MSDKIDDLVNSATAKELWIAAKLKKERDRLEAKWDSGYYPKNPLHERGDHKTKWFPECKNWPWEKTNTMIAREIGVSVSTVSKWREKLGKPGATVVEKRNTNPHIAIASSLVNWESVDWSLSDAIIAGQIKRTRECVRQQRAKLGKPKIPFPNMQENFHAYRRWVGERKEVQYCDVPSGLVSSYRQFKVWSNVLGVKSDSFNYYRYRQALKHPWHLMNFELPNLVLSDVWNVSAMMVASRRSNHMMPKAKGMVRLGVVPEKMKAPLEEEHRKAAEWFAQKATKTHAGEENATTGNVEPPNPSQNAP